MPEWLLVVVLAVFLAAAVHRLAVAIHTARRPAPAPAAQVFRDPRPLVACHRTSCGHMSWPHDVAQDGALLCSNCGQINDTA
ncbi:hypothetical protein [Streptomyces sp. CA-146814]|uniref:hypothetical protein n=1 Tax=Streptomyces sp. CA-146814 TaxID=3240053 RepID=UPI003D8F8B13